MPVGVHALPGRSMGEYNVEILRLGPAGAERPAVRVAGTVYDLSSVTTDIDGAFLGSGGMDRVRAAVTAGSLPELAGADSLRVGAPISRPAAVLCIGQNYVAHAAESGSPPPERPILFFKHPNTIIGPNDDVTLPPASQTTDWEVELAVVIGKQAHLLGDDVDPLEYVAGYTVANDVSERTYQRQHSSGQWAKGKCFPTFCPLGPALVPASEVSPQEMAIRSWVNGEARQNSSTKDMIFSVATLVRDLSQYLRMEPGDLICTGTPEGVAMSGRYPFLKDGDTMELEVEGLGRMRQHVKAS
jgi:2-keto-4-pentenoate hydratase/2-oxohepta-3-ene-1,7-dioic acid hydratase in catechol pathway